MKAKCLWFTALPCAGKTTIARKLLRYFPKAQLLDGDEIRNTPLAKDVGFSPEDRAKHILRMGQIAKMLVDNGVTAICSFVSPSREIRNQVRDMFNDGDFLEIFVDTPIDVCVKRDVKGMYKKALSGEIKNFTGIQAPYEAPESPELTVYTHKESVEESVKKVLDFCSPFKDRACFFIGRWNGIFHNGHNHIIKQKLDEGKSVIMAVRNVEPDEKNPWTAKEVKEMLEYRWKDNPNVEIIIIPDVLSVEYGRGVGYGVNEIKVTEKIAGISGTECRKLIAEGDDSWKNFVPDEIVEFMIQKRDDK